MGRFFRKKTRFANFNRIEYIPRIEDLSEEEMFSTWWSQEELEQIKQTCILTLKLASSDDAIPERAKGDLCLRGLEAKTPLAAKRRWETKKLAWKIVLDEQWEQWDKNIDDPEALAEVYRRFALNSEKRAQLVGLKDAEASKQTIIEEMNYSR